MERHIKICLFKFWPHKLYWIFTSVANNRPIYHPSLLLVWALHWIFFTTEWTIWDLMFTPGTDGCRLYSVLVPQDSFRCKVIARNLFRFDASSPLLPLFNFPSLLSLFCPPFPFVTKRPLKSSYRAWGALWCILLPEKCNSARYDLYLWPLILKTL